MRILCISIVVLCSALSLPSTAASAYVINIGFINQRVDEPRFTLKLYGSLINYINEKLQVHNAQAKVILVNNQAEMLDKAAQHAVDMVGESMFSSLRLRQGGHMQPWIAAWRKGIRQYQTFFVVHQASNLHRLADLKGQHIVFESPRSTSAYALPKAILLQQQFTVVAQTQTSTKTAIRYSFAGDEMTQAYQVALKRADAAAFNTSDWQETPQTVRQQLRIIHRSQPILRWMFSIHRDFPAELKPVVQAILLDMVNNEIGRAILQQSKLTRFDALMPADYAVLEEVEGLLAFLE